MKKAISWLLFAVWLLVACSSPTPKPTQSPLFSSLVPTPVGAEMTLRPAFKLDPVTAGSTQVTGQGPVGFTLVVVDSTFGGMILGTGKPDAGGNFRIQLNKPLEKGHLIGLTVDLPSDLAGSEEFNKRLYEIRGPGYRLVPNAVNIFDSHEVP
jgi:hypothetical protein